jgi:hypothetical protein
MQKNRTVRYIIMIFIMILLAGATGDENRLFSGADPGWREIMKKPDQLNGYYYLTPYAYSNKHYGVMRVWNQGYAQRVEMVNHGSGETTILLTRQQDGAYYQIDPKRNEAIGFRYREEAIPPGVLDESRYAVSGNRYDPLFLSQVGEVEETVYQNQDVLLLQYQSSHNNSSEIYRAWISVEFGLPLKEEMEMGDGRIHQRFYLDLQEGPFSPDLFVLPEDINIVSWTWFN